MSIYDEVCLVLGVMNEEPQPLDLLGQDQLSRHTQARKKCGSHLELLPHPHLCFYVLFQLSFRSTEDNNKEGTCPREDILFLTCTQSETTCSSVYWGNGTHTHVCIDRSMGTHMFRHSVRAEYSCPACFYCGWTGGYVTNSL